MGFSEPRKAGWLQDSHIMWIVFITTFLSTPFLGRFPKNHIIILYHTLDKEWRKQWSFCSNTLELSSCCLPVLSFCPPGLSSLSPHPWVPGAVWSSHLAVLLLEPCRKSGTDLPWDLPCKEAPNLSLNSPHSLAYGALHNLVPSTEGEHWTLLLKLISSQNNPFLQNGHGHKCLHLSFPGVSDKGTIWQHSSFF